MKELLIKIKNLFTKNEIVNPTAVLAVICIVVTLALSSTNLLTKDRIEKLAIKTQNEAMAKLIEADEYTELPAKTSLGEVNYHAAIKDGDTIGILLVTEANGYGGTIKVMTAVDMDCSIVAIEILDASGETPGLGQNVTKESFYSQFKGESGQIDAVTGATISSTGVTNAVNQALKYANEIIGNQEVATETIENASNDKEVLE